MTTEKIKIKTNFKQQNIIFGVIMATLMAFGMSLAMTASVLGFNKTLLYAWPSKFLIAVAVAVPYSFIANPIAKKITSKILKN
ncbi:DUF2798 domain-containing protein [Methanococcus voltae]|uniref:DUF2798 domain-containing protein n=1 Tax=Methanococcus voltae (strain ATCC BAA-1334 / A3) TaxID=456320 RepID=D7DRR9_METV3|nr:DUF2798 domain-containing protein [Methanococcus voltae]MCS3901147.1 hypothetical protein [Methanococcus voltae]